jgi:predicted RNA-binding Zn ribbon-like protein
LADFGRLIGDLDWNEEVQKEQLYEGLSEEIKDALITTRPKHPTLKVFVQTCKELDNRIRARNAERNSRSNQRPPFRPATASTSGTTTQTPSTPIPKNPTATNSGYYGAAPMDLSAAQKITERNRIKQERITKGECFYCGNTGHFLRECPHRAAAHARRLTMAAATITVDPAPAPEITPSTEQSEN